MARARKEGVRYPNGKLVQKPAIDKGTVELQLRRILDAGDGDPNLTCTALGILRANDQINEDEYRSGCLYRRLFAVVYRKPEISAAGGSVDSFGEIDEEAILDLRNKLKRLEWAVASVSAVHGRIAKDVWDNLVLYGRRPRWMMPVFPRATDVREGELFLMVIREVTTACGRAEKTRAA